MKTVIILAILASFSSYADVWSNKNTWTKEFEAQYSEWAKSSQLSSDIFSNPQSPYYGIKTDCADATIAIRTIFAFEHQLPIYFRDNNGSVISNRSNKYDHLQSSSRLKAFLTDIGESIGSEILASDNTYPIALSNIRPGDLYITRWIDNSGIDTRHVYFVKDILPTGDLLLFSSTQPRAVRPLLARKGMPSHIIPGEPYGFKRFTTGPRFEKPDQSFSQYDDLKKGGRYYFSKIKETHQKIKDTFENNINQRIENICIALQTRISVVASALDQFEKNNHHCFTQEEYDEYSTPSRDHNIDFDIESLVFGWKTIKEKNIQANLSEKTQLALDYLSEETDSPEALNQLNSFCFIEISNFSLNIKNFHDLYKSGAISSNPNESIEARWGQKSVNGICPKR